MRRGGVAQAPGAAGARAAEGAVARLGHTHDRASNAARQTARGGAGYGDAAHLGWSTGDTAVDG